MGIVTLAIFTFSAIGIQASIFLQVAHGFVSSALFIMVTILYEHHHSRLVKYYKGVTLTMPLFSLVFLIFTLSNINYLQIDDNLETNIINVYDTTIKSMFNIYIFWKPNFVPKHPEIFNTGGRKKS